MAFQLRFLMISRAFPIRRWRRPLQHLPAKQSLSPITVFFFDLPFMQAELKAAELEPLENKIVDTLHLARRKFPGAPASLDALCSRFGINTKERERDGHGALLDSRLLAEVYIELTGGAQAGLNFIGADKNSDPSSQSRGAKAPVKQRPRALASKLSADEKSAHETFVAELGEEAMWRRMRG